MKTIEKPHAVKLIAASRCTRTNQRIYTLQLRYWRAFHAELMTHRAFSRNASSSRAIPVAKMISQVWKYPAGPSHWGKNQPGMQARSEVQGLRRRLAQALWRTSGKVMCVAAWVLMRCGVHKQVANRLLEPWQFINVVVTSTEWDNFFQLRCHPDAMPEFQALAQDIGWVISTSRDSLRDLKPGEWHLPYITDEERVSLPLESLLKVSAARCARVSYKPFDGEGTISGDIALYEKLAGGVPIHASPTEHQAQATGSKNFHKNFKGFRQFRDYIEQGRKAWEHRSD